MYLFRTSPVTGPDVVQQEITERVDDLLA